jgi:hypothetical protein
MPPIAPPKKEDAEKEKKIRKIVNKGGGSTVKEDWTMISVRLPDILLRELDAATEKRFGLSRNAWILEAIQEKLKE